MKKSEKLLNVTLWLLVAAFGFQMFNDAFGAFLARRMSGVWVVSPVEAVEAFVCNIFGKALEHDTIAAGIRGFLILALFYVPFMGGMIAAAKKSKPLTLCFTILLDMQIVLTIVAVATRFWDYHNAVYYGSKDVILWPVWGSFLCMIAATATILVAMKKQEA